MHLAAKPRARLRIACAATSVIAFTFLAGARVLLAATALLAQDEQQGGLRVRQGGGKNYVLETVVVLALFGLALYTICRSSRRV